MRRRASDAAAAVDVPGGAAVPGRGGCEFGYVETVVLVADLSDDLLHDVLQGDDAGGAAVSRR